MSVSYGCGKSDDNLFNPVAGSGGVAAQGGSSSVGGTANTGGSSNTTGGVAVGGSGGVPSTSGGSSATSGGSSAGSISTGGIDMGGAGGDGSAGDAGLGGSATGGSVTGGSSSGGAAGGSAPQLLSGSQPIAAFKGLHCESVSFPTAFSAPAGDIQVQATAVHPAATLTHGALSVWVQSVTASSFEVCMTEDADLNSSHLASRLDWLAYVATTTSLSGAAGRLALGAVKDRSCQEVTFPTAFAAAPQLQLTPNHVGAPDAPNDPSSAWAEEVSATGFRLCVEELEDADGELDGTNVDWLAYPQTIATAGFSAGERNITTFTGTRCVDIQTGCENCQNVQVSANHRRRTESANNSHDPVLIWAEDFTAAGVLTACVRQTSDYGGSHDAHLSIDWLARKTND